jgi:hypothetical protein
MKYLDRLREKTENSLDMKCQRFQKPSFDTFGTSVPGASLLFEPLVRDPSDTFSTPQVEGTKVFQALPPPTIADRYPPDELGEPCPDCGGIEKWRWLDGRLLCRTCLIRGDPSPAEARATPTNCTPAAVVVEDGATPELR